MDAIFSSIGLPLGIVIAVGLTIAAYVYFGRRGAQIAGALAAALLAVFAIRKDAKSDAQRERVEKDLKNERERAEQVRDADRAADRARIDNATGGLRNDDGFRRD